MKTQKQHHIFFILAIALLLSVTGCSTDSNSDPQAPLANAGPDQKVVIGEKANLDGSGSGDPEGGDLTYNWSITDKPAGSSAVIVGTTNIATSFVLDKAGVYTVELEVSSGERSATDRVTITNRTPIIGGVFINNKDNNVSFLEDEGKAERGDLIDISGNFFSSDLTENHVTIDGEECEITFVDSNSLSVTVPDAATSGDLVITVGEESVTAPNPIKVVILPIQERFREVTYDVDESNANDLLNNNGLTTGFYFTTSVSGKITHLGLLLVTNAFRKVTIWNADSTMILHTQNIEGSSSSRFRNSALTEPVSLEPGVRYVIGVRIPEDEVFSRTGVVFRGGGTSFEYPIEAGSITVETRGFIFGDSMPNSRREFTIEGIPDIIFETD